MIVLVLAPNYEQYRSWLDQVDPDFKDSRYVYVNEERHVLGYHPDRVVILDDPRRDWKYEFIQRSRALGVEIVYVNTDEMK